MRDIPANTYRMPERKGESAEMAPNQVFKDILKIQQEVNQSRINYFANPNSRRKSGSVLDLFNIFKEPTFMEQHKAPKNTDDLINLEAEIGGALFDRAWPGIPQKSFFYNKNKRYLYISDGVNDQTTRFHVAEHGAVKVISNGRHEELMTPEEIQNLSLSTKLYQQKINEEIYGENANDRSDFVLAA